MSYENWSREDLIDELSRLRRLLDNEGKLRDKPAEEIHIDTLLDDAWYADQELVKNIFSRILEFVYYVEMDSKGLRQIRFASPHIEHIYGISREEYMNNATALASRIHPEDMQAIREATGNLYISKIPQTFTYRLFHKKKDKYVWLEETVYPKLNDNGDIYGNLGVIRDVTEKVEAEIKLRRSQASLENVLNAINQVVYHFDFSTQGRPKVLYLSSNIEDLLGVDYDEYYNDPLKFGQYCHPDDLPGVLSILREQKKDHLPKTYRYRFLHLKTKEYFWLEEYVVKTYDADNNVLTAFGITRNITEQKEAEDRLRTSEERFRMLAQNADDIIFRLSLEPSPHYEYISPSIETITGYSPEEFYKDPLAGFNLIHPDDRGPFIHSQEVIAGKKKPVQGSTDEENYVVRWVRKDGQIIWTETRNKRIIDASGKTIAVEGISRDITRSKKAEEEIIASREFYRTLIEQSPDGIIFLDLKGNLLSANPEAYKIMGATDGYKLKSKNIFEYVVPDFHDYTRNRLGKVMKGEQVPFGVIQVYDVHGETIEVESKPILYEFQGSPAIIVFVRDLSVFRKLEKEQLRVQVMEENNQKLQNEIQERIRAERQLSETQKNLRLLFDSSLDTISSADRDGHITEFNAAAERTFGYTREEALGEHLSILFGGDEEQAALVTARLQADGYYSGEVTNKRKNGQLFTSLLAASLLRNEEGEVIGSMGVSRDITERKTFERQLLETQKYLRLLIDSSIDMIIASDKDGNITEFNAMAEQAFGYTREEALKMHVNQLYKNDDEGRRISKTLMEENSYFSGEIINKRKNGEEFNSFLSASILRNEDGEVVGSMGISRDISDRLKAEQELRLREEKYRAVFNQAYTGIALVSVESGNYIEVNERLCNMLGYSKTELLEMTVHDLQLPGDLSRLPKGEDFIKLGFRHIVDEHRYRHKNGDTVFVNITITLVRGDDNQPLHFVYVYEDLTPKRKTEEQLRIQAAKLNAIIESSTHIIWTIDRHNKLTSFNHNQADWFKRAYNEVPYIGLDMLGYSFRMSEEYARFWDEKVQKTFAGEPQYFELPSTMKDGTIAWREVYLNPITGHNDEVIEVSCIAHEITEMKRAQEKIHRQAEQLNAIIESSTHMIWTSDREHKMTSFNKQQSDWILRAYGMRPWVGMPIDEVKKRTGEAYSDFWDQKFIATFAGKPQYFESKFEHKNGQITWREVYLNPIRNEKGEVVELSCIAHDITEKKAIDENLRQSLKEKEVLLKEVHHRVKNNLQVISSILNLQKAYVRDKKTLELLHESQNRIKSMAFVHESLYQTKDFSNINFADYIGNVTRNLMHSYASTESPPELELSLAPIQLNLDTAIPCGLIINELLSNALKYAFRKKKNGKITLQLTENQGNIKIVIADNGSGLPETVDYRNTESLGLQLVVTLVEQINGKIKLENKKGAKFTIEFTSIPANP
ncbi:MAG: PAS domain S-box protein [Bacteroidia bacterium]|jgi:PAS domain S-box-containing protein|nr:PAS domain S-box protein [Bacteroidia bacterium]